MSHLQWVTCSELSAVSHLQWVICSESPAQVTMDEEVFWTIALTNALTHVTEVGDILFRLTMTSLKCYCKIGCLPRTNQTKNSLSKVTVTSFVTVPNWTYCATQWPLVELCTITILAGLKNVGVGDQEFRGLWICKCCWYLLWSVYVTLVTKFF